MKLSIIVPIYNVAPYLCKCVDSLLMQDISDYEIILVDDGSPDECPQICNEYAATHENIIVIHQDNAGLSAARNSGITIARGEYIWFVDSDDYIEPNVLNALMEQIERDDLDVLRFRYQNVKENGEAFAPYKDMTNYNDYSITPTDGLSFLNSCMSTQCYAWQFIVRSTICRQENFTPGIYFEDTDWTPRMLLKANRVASTEKIIYKYLWREGSITQTSNKDKLRRQLHDKLDILDRLNTLGNSVTDRKWFDGMIAALTLSIVGLIASSFYTERRKYVNKLKKFDILPIVTHNMSKKAQIKIKLINKSVYLTILLLKLNDNI